MKGHRAERVGWTQNSDSTAETDLSRERAHLRERMGVLDGEEERFKEAKKMKKPLDTGRPR